MATHPDDPNVPQHGEQPKSEAKPAEAKPAEAKPAEAKPAEAKPAETKPGEAQAKSAKHTTLPRQPGKPTMMQRDEDESAPATVPNMSLEEPEEEIMALEPVAEETEVIPPGALPPSEDIPVLEAVADDEVTEAMAAPSDVVEAEPASAVAEAEPVSDVAEAEAVFDEMTAEPISDVADAMPVSDVRSRSGRRRAPGRTCRGRRSRGPSTYSATTSRTPSRWARRRDRMRSSPPSRPAGSRRCWATSRSIADRGRLRGSNRPSAPSLTMTRSTWVVRRRGASRSRLGRTIRMRPRRCWPVSRPAVARRRSTGTRSAPIRCAAVKSVEDETVPFDVLAEGSSDDSLLHPEDLIRHADDSSSAINLGELPPKSKSPSGIDVVAEALESGVNLEDEAPVSPAPGTPSVEFDDILADSSESMPPVKKGAAKKPADDVLEALEPTDDDLDAVGTGKKKKKKSSDDAAEEEAAALYGAADESEAIAVPAEDEAEAVAVADEDEAVAAPVADEDTEEHAVSKKKDKAADADEEPPSSKTRDKAKPAPVPVHGPSCLAGSLARGSSRSWACWLRSAAWPVSPSCRPVSSSRCLDRRGSRNGRRRRRKVVQLSPRRRRTRQSRPAISMRRSSTSKDVPDEPAKAALGEARRSSSSRIAISPPSR